MGDRFIESGIIYLLGFATVPVTGLLLVCSGLWGDRSKGQSRCPKCWYDMRGTLPKLEYPECGHDAAQECRLYRTRRRPRRIVIGILLVLIFSYPLSIVGEWYREQSSIRRLTKHGHTVRLMRAGPDWLVGWFPERFALLLDHVESIRLVGSATDADLAACEKLSRLQSIVLAQLPQLAGCNGPGGSVRAGFTRKFSLHPFAF